MTMDEVAFWWTTTRKAEDGLYVCGSHPKVPSSLRADGRIADDAVRAAGRSVDYCEFRTGSTGAIRPVPRWEDVAADSSW